jgi:phosphoglycolate phosphatase-like HAD superfamily hydrolase
MSTIVFDGDETLWFSAQEYDSACFEFLLYLHSTALPPHTPVSGDYTYNLYAKHFEKINAKTGGIKRGRVAKSMVDTYRFVCSEIQKTRGIDVYNKKHEDHVWKIGDKPFDVTKHPWAPGAEKMLEELVKRGHTLCVLTKYDQETWHKEKAIALDVHRFVKTENILAIHDRKTPEHFLQVSRAHEKGNEDFITVGNSKDDLIMVTEVENKLWRGFYIAIPTTSPMESESDADWQLPLPSIDHPRVVTVKNVTDILDSCS